MSTPRPSRRPLAVLLLLLATLWTTGCFKGMAEDQVRKMMPKILGKADRYDVRISNTNDGQLLKGHLTDITITGQRVRVKDGPVLHRIRVDMHNLEVDTKKKQIKSVENATFDIDLLEGDVTAMARKKLRVTDALVVAFRPDTVIVTLPASLLGQNLDLTVRGGLAVQGGTRVLFVPSEASIGRVRFPDQVTRQLERINPVTDVRSLPVPARIDTVTVTNGMVNVKGHLYPREVAPTPSPSPSAAPSPQPSPTATPSPSPSRSPLPSPSPSPAASPRRLR